MRLRSVPRPSIPSAYGGHDDSRPSLGRVCFGEVRAKKDGVSVQNTVKHLFFAGTGSLCRVS